MSQTASILRLSELARLISEVFRQTLGGERFWVTAEIIGLKVNRGHCYLQLAEKDEITTTPKAEFRGIIWASAFEKLHARFIRETGSPLKELQQVLICVEVTYHERYGMSLQVHDLDPSYTLGQMELERRKIIERLRAEGVFDLNRNLSLSLVPQRIAVIAAADSRGYEDFMTALQKNAYGIDIGFKLFHSLMQGDLAAADICAKLAEIRKLLPKLQFDAVVIVRGGGSVSSMECFNRYELAAAIAAMPIPVVCGIGHTADKSISDQVAHTSVITPTDAAVFIINTCAAYAGQVESLLSEIVEIATAMHSDEVAAMDQYASQIRSASSELLLTENHSLQQSTWNMRATVSALVTGEQQALVRMSHRASMSGNKQVQEEQFALRLHETTVKNQLALHLHKSEAALDALAARVAALDPQAVLRRGYSMTLKDGKPVTSENEVANGDTITTIIAEGQFTSIVQKNNG